MLYCSQDKFESNHIHALCIHSQPTKVILLIILHIFAGFDYRDDQAKLSNQVWL